MKAPQVVMIVLFGMELLYALVNNGKPRAGVYDVSATAMALITEYLLLQWGGFWDGKR